MENPIIDEQVAHAVVHARLCGGCLSLIARVARGKAEIFCAEAKSGIWVRNNEQEITKKHIANLRGPYKFAFAKSCRASA